MEDEKLATMEQGNTSTVDIPARKRALRKQLVWCMVSLGMFILGLVAYGLVENSARGLTQDIAQFFYAPLLNPAPGSIATLQIPTPPTLNGTGPTPKWAFNASDSGLVASLAAKTIELTYLQQEFSTNLTAHNEFHAFHLGRMRSVLSDIVMVSLSLPSSSPTTHDDHLGLQAPIITKLLELAKGDNKTANANEALTYLRGIAGTEKINLVHIAGLVMTFTVATRAMDDELAVWDAYVKKTMATVETLIDGVQKSSFQVLNLAAFEEVGMIEGSSPRFLRIRPYLKEVEEKKMADRLAHKGGKRAEKSHLW